MRFLKSLSILLLTLAWVYAPESRAESLHGTIAYAQPSRIYFQELESTRLSALYVPVSIISSVDLSSDGRRVVFTGKLNSQANSEIYIINRDGSGFKNLTNSVRNEFAAVFSPDGKSIAFHSASGAPDALAELEIMNFDGSGRRHLVDPDAYPYAVQPSFSQDGSLVTFIGFTAPMSLEFLVLAVPIEGGSPKLLTYTGDRNLRSNPVFLGKELLYSSFSSNPDTFENFFEFRAANQSSHVDRIVYKFSYIGSTTWKAIPVPDPTRGGMPAARPNWLLLSSPDGLRFLDIRAGRIKRPEIYEQVTVFSYNAFEASDLSMGPRPRKLDFAPVVPGLMQDR